MGQLTLVTGGARSGKSQFAEKLIADSCREIAYIATAVVFDEEMEDRVKRHRLQRPAVWHTFEESYHPSIILEKHGSPYDGILLDCLTVLTTNLILRDRTMDWERPSIEQMSEIEAEVVKETEELLQALEGYTGRLVAVTNEVGLGIVPETPLSRFFRDCCGRVNQRMAAAADEVYLIVSGLPLRLKGGNGA